MNKLHKKALLIFILLIVNLSTLVGCQYKDVYKNNLETSDNITNINENNAKVLSIQNDDNNLHKVITNISKFSIYDILVKYEELNEQNNIISKSELFLDLTLNPNESSEISFINDDNVKNINIVSYEYNTLDKTVSVNTIDNEVVIKTKNELLKDSKEYEVLTTSKIYKVKNSNGIDIYALDIKNTSKKELGNITVKIGQLDKHGKYIMVDSISSYNILKPSETISMEIKALENTNNIQLLGYSYDDIKEKANINIDLKLHKASVSG